MNAVRALKPVAVCLNARYQGLFGKDQPELTGIIAWRGIVSMNRLPEHMRRQFRPKSRTINKFRGHSRTGRLAIRIMEASRYSRGMCQ
jgi:hypothetical protein